LRVPFHEGLLPWDDREAPAHDALRLRRNSDVRPATPEQLDVSVIEVRICVDAAADVEPLDEDRAVEARGIGRTPHQKACLVVGSGRGLDGPFAILARRRLPVVSSGVALGEVLLLDVTRRWQVDERVGKRLSRTCNRAGEDRNLAAGVDGVAGVDRRILRRLA
jgi:hypothetical protein